MRGFPVDKSQTISLEEAQRLILGVVEALDSEVVPLAAGCGRVLAEEVRARRDYPPSPRSAMDGYAVRSGDLVHLPPEGLIAPRPRHGRPTWPCRMAARPCRPLPPPGRPEDTSGHADEACGAPSVADHAVGTRGAFPRPVPANRWESA